MGTLARTEPSPDCGGKNCIYNGTFSDKDGNLIECRCDECDYLMCCVSQSDCGKCDIDDCAFFK